MADISTYLQAIMEAVYGEEVRGSIHDAIEIINDVAEKVLTPGTAVTSTTSSSEGFFKDSLYLNTDTWDLWKCVGTNAWTKLGNIKGATGKGISSIEKTGTAGLIDTYTITYTEGPPTTFTVVNGKGIVEITGPERHGLVDTYTIVYNDGSPQTFDVTNGIDGNRIFRGTVVSGESTTPTIFPTSGITDAIYGDLYLNISEGAFYHCETPGDASTATWTYDFTIAGGGSSVTQLDDLTDVTTSSLTDGDVLIYDDNIGEFLNKPSQTVYDALLEQITKNALPIISYLVDESDNRFVDESGNHIVASQIVKFNFA